MMLYNLSFAGWVMKGGISIQTQVLFHPVTVLSHRGKKFNKDKVSFTRESPKCCCQRHTHLLNKYRVIVKGSQSKLQALGIRKTWYTDHLNGRIPREEATPM